MFIHSHPLACDTMLLFKKFALENHTIEGRKKYYKKNPTYFKFIILCWVHSDFSWLQATGGIHLQ